MARFQPIPLAIFAAFLPFAPALADGAPTLKDAPVSAPWSAGLMVSTLGPGLQASYQVYNWAVLRAEGTYLTIPADGLSLDLRSAGAILDLHPFENAFRVSGGLRYFEYNLSGTTSGGTDRFSVHATNSDRAAPYAGLGFDSSHFSGGKYEFKLGLDLGVVYSGKPSVTVTNLTNPGADVQAEVDKYVSKYRFLDFYPVATVSARINF